MKDVLLGCKELILAANHRPRVVAIDGQGGSGKSTFAKKLVESIGDNAVIVEGDDFYRDMPDDERAKLSPAEGYDQYFDWQRLKQQIFEPANARATLLRYQKYDWDNARMGEWVELPMPEILIVEGVYSTRPEFAGLIDVRIYVETSEAERVKRQVDRGENEDEWIKRWVAAEDFYVATTDPARRADVVVSGSS